MVSLKAGITNPKWFERAYDGIESITAVYELQIKDDLIRPGDKIKFKNDRGTYLFRCIASSSDPEIEDWIDCIKNDAGSWHSFRVGNLKEVVKPKRSRRKKLNGD